MTIHPSRRIAWDIFVFAVIAASAFEIPYDFLVGWENQALANAFDAAFCTVFLVDMVLNAMTLRERTYGGLWGWRNIAGLVRRSWGPEALRQRPQSGPMVLETPREIRRGYFTSGWFLIDLASTIPWGLFLAHYSLLGNLRMLRLLRLARLFRFLRLTKTFVLFERIRRVMPDVPSLERLLLTVGSMPWLAHLHACMFLAAERTNPDVEVTYASAFHVIFITFTTNNEIAGSLSVAGFWIGISAVCCSILFIASVTGNLAALYTGLELSPKKRSQVMRSGHTILLGWTSTLFSVVDQLSTNDERGRPNELLLMADRPVEEMWADLEEYTARFVPGQITPVQGSLTSITAIRSLGLARARQVIVLGEEALQSGQAESLDDEERARACDLADAHVLRTVLACCQAMTASQADFRHSEREPLPVVAAVRSLESMRTIQGGVPARARTQIALRVVDTSDILARCIAQVANRPGMARVFRELLSYTGSDGGPSLGSAEFYSEPVSPGLVGQAYRRLVQSFPSAIPVGYCVGDRVVLNPGFASGEADYELTAQDRLVFLARSREEIGEGQPRDIELPAAFAPTPVQRPKRTVLVLGSGAKFDRVTELLPAFLPRGSEVFHEPVLGGSPTITLSGSMVGECDTVVVVAEASDRVSHDARVLMSLTRLNARSGGRLGETATVIELLDPRNMDLVDAFGAPVTLLSAELVSNYLVQLAADSHRGGVFRELLDPEGCEIYLRPAARYLGAEGAQCFEEVQRRGFVVGETVIGFQTDDAGLVLCPLGEQRTAPLIAAGDEVVVIAEEDIDRLS